jgi:type I restriction enzyme S subunit
MAKITPCMENGKVTVVPDLPGSVCFGSTEFHVFRSEHGIVPSWIAKFLLQNDFRRAAQRAMTGGVGQMRVPAEFLETVRLPLAPSNEQCRIADALDELFTDLDAGIAALERARTRLAHYRGAVLKAAVDGTLTAEWRQQHPHAEPASELLKHILAERRSQWEEEQLRKLSEKGKEPSENWKTRYKDPPAPASGTLLSLPAGWCWATVEQVGFVQLGRQRAPQHHQGQFMRPYLRVANVYEDRIDLSSVLHMNFTPKEFETYKLRNGDVLLNEGQSIELVGRPAIYRDELPGACFQNTLIRFRPFPGVLAEYALTYFRSCLRNHRFRKLARWTTNIAHLGAERFAGAEFPLPPFAEQEAIVEAVEDQLSVVDHLQADLEVKLKSAQGLRHAILYQAFTGKLIPQDPNDEPASELLKSIAAEREARAREAGAAKRAPVKTGASRLAARRPRKKKAKES